MKKILPALVISATIITSTVVVSNAYTYKQRHSGSVSVTGQGTRDFKSDLIVWNGTFISKNLELKDAYEQLKIDQDKIKTYLIEQGVKEEELVFSSVDINKDFDYFYDDNGNRTSKFTGYRLSQRVEIESNNIEKIEEVSRKITELINQGIEFYSNNPQYYYTKLSELKIEMISAATEDARLRAQKIAENAGSSLSELKDARMGIFQIIGQNSNEDYSWGGTFNTSSKMKTATITMKLRFELE